VSLGQKLVLYALAAALLPLAASGFTLVRLGEDALRARIQAHERTAATAVAASVDQTLRELAERAVTAMELTDPLRLTPDERLGLLRLVHRQSPSVRASVLLDARGQLLVRPVTALADAAEMPADLAVAAVAKLRENLPTPAAVTAAGREAHLSAPWFPGSGPARVALAVACCAGSDGKPRALAGVELALGADLLTAAALDTGEQSRIVLVDRFGRVIAHPSLPVGSDLSGHPAVRALHAGGVAGNVRYADEQGAWEAAFAPVGGFGWGVVVEQPEVVAFADAARMRRRTITWISGTAVAVALSALLFAAALRRRLGSLMTGARAFAAGRLGERVPATSTDELGELATTLNGMAGALEKSLREIDAWSRTLEEKVDERTRELRQAQTQLLLQSKLAAIGQLGAGVAHEVNNPLAGILGYVQLLLRKRDATDPDHASLKKIEEAAQRCKAVTTSLLRFSQRGLTGRAPIDPGVLAVEVLDLMAGGLVDAGLSVERHLAPDVGTITADAGQLALVLINLVGNARNATAPGGTLTVTTQGGGDDVRILVADTGHGIEPEHLERIFDPFFTTKKNWTGVGLGLSVAYRIVSDHGGRIEVESTVGKGSVFTVVLPRVPPPTTEPEAPRLKRPVLLA
jgi:signal transduction histidine kinase